MDVGNIGVEKYYVSQLFNQDESFVYEVPKYQREYKWRVREWEALYDDLTFIHGFTARPGCSVLYAYAVLAETRAVSGDG